jgi:hypothetical protein
MEREAEAEAEAGRLALHIARGTYFSSVLGLNWEDLEPLDWDYLLIGHLQNILGKKDKINVLEMMPMIVHLSDDEILRGPFLRPNSVSVSRMI